MEGQVDKKLREERAEVWTAYERRADVPNIDAAGAFSAYVLRSVARSAPRTLMPICWRGSGLATDSSAGCSRQRLSRSTGESTSLGALNAAFAARLNRGLSCLFCARPAVRVGHAGSPPGVASAPLPAASYRSACGFVSSGRGRGLSPRIGNQ
jgi:hypothetical protein